jgi:segregation and condensation protein A
MADEHLELDESARGAGGTSLEAGTADGSLADGAYGEAGVARGAEVAVDAPASASTAEEKPFALQSPAVLPPPEPKRPTAARMDSSVFPFSVTVGQVYDGPLDLLLDLIRKQDIDIYDIPIAKITAQFLAYCEHLRQTDVDAAGEFIYMASLLIHVKSRTLLPRELAIAAAGEADDPRRELVERLLEHERFKSAAQMLMQKQQIEEATWTHSGLKGFLRDEAEAAGEDAANPDGQEIAADTVDLVRVFQEVLERLKTRPVINVDEDSVTVAQMIDYVRRRLVLEERPISLRRMLRSTHSERAVISMFLALLELVRLQAVLLHQPVVQGDILIKKTAGFEQVFVDQQAVRDDWQ